MSDPIDGLLDQATAHAKKRTGTGAGAGPADPSSSLVVDFAYEFPRDELTAYDRIADGRHDLIELREDERGERGMFARRDVAAGTRLAIGRPVAVIWNVENEEGRGGRDAECAQTEQVHDDGGGGGRGCGHCNFRDTAVEGRLVLRALDAIESSPSAWEELLTKLHPRDAEAASALPPWTCADAAVRSKVDERMKGLVGLSLFPPERNGATCAEIARRLPLVVRYNAFVVETSPELFVYADPKRGTECLAGAGLYGPELSYFNHSCAPNASKFSIGDVTFLFANRDVSMGEELCHSYYSHEYLCESERTRRAILANDFRCAEEEEEAKRPAKRRKGDSAQWNDVVCVAPFVLSKRFDPATGRLYKSEGPDRDFLCNSEYLFPIWKARTLEGLGRSNGRDGDERLGLACALPEWEAAVEFAEAHFPPLDARKVALYVQASLCASVNAFRDWRKLALGSEGSMRVGDRAKARHYAEKALGMHHAIFGGWKRRFLKRYVEEFLASDSFREQMSRAQLLCNVEVLWSFGNKTWDELTASEKRLSP